MASTNVLLLGARGLGVEIGNAFHLKISLESPQYSEECGPSWNSLADGARQPISHDNRSGRSGTTPAAVRNLRGPFGSST